MSSALPHVMQLHSKTGKADCTIAAMATIFRRDYEEVLIAAAKVSPTVWKAGLACTEMLKVAHRLKVKARWKHNPDFEDDIGVLIVGYNDKIEDHAVVLIEGWIIDPEWRPPTMWHHIDFFREHNAYGTTLLEVIE
jgi:hypothetical protein